MSYCCDQNASQLKTHLENCKHESRVVVYNGAGSSGFPSLRDSPAMFDKVSIVCIASSYGVSFLLEVSRLFFRLPVRLVVMLGFAFAGLVAHSIVLIRDAQPGFAAGVPFSNWHLWFLLAAWIVAAVYLALASTRPQASLGIFMLPVVFGLLTASHMASREEFTRDSAHASWGMIHGIALLLGTVSMAFGFIAGSMYWIQSYRLKHKLLPMRGFQLPSLEWLQSVNKQTLYWSSCFVTGGLFAGFILNAIRQVVPWNDQVILSSSVLLAWLMIATLFELFYKPAQQGRKVAYLTVASFVFLALVLALALSGNSAHTRHSESSSTTSSIPEEAP
jgi:hypothetical protein